MANSKAVSSNDFDWQLPPRTYITETTTDSTDIPTANLGFMTVVTAWWAGIKCRQVIVTATNSWKISNMAAKTGSIYISGTTTDSIEIPTAKPGVFDHGELEKCVGKWLRQSATIKSVNMGAKTAILSYSAIGRWRGLLGTLYSSLPWSKISDLPLEFQSCLL